MRLSKRLPKWLLSILGAGLGGIIGYFIGANGPLVAFLLYSRLVQQWPPDPHKGEGIAMLGFFLIGPIMVVIGCIVGSIITSRAMIRLV